MGAKFSDRPWLTGSTTSRTEPRGLTALARACVAPLLCAIPVTLTAQPEDPPLTEMDFFAELPVVLHATRLRQPVADTPASITIIDQAFIRASTAATIPELLRFVAGFQVAYPSGNETTATYRGLGDQHARRMQVLVDGRSVYNQMYGGILWDIFPVTIEDVDRIEVIRGPNAAAYGANSFLGVINIVTKDPAKFPGTSTRLDAGSRDTRRTHVRHAGRSGDFDFGISAFYEQQDGFDSQFDDLAAAHVDFHGGLQLNNQDRLEFGLSYRDADTERGFIAEPEFRVDRDADSQHQLLRWRRVLAPEDEYKLTFFHNNQRSQAELFALKMSEYLSLLARRPVSPQQAAAVTGRPDQIAGVDYSYDIDRYELEFERTQRATPDLRFVWGGTYRQDRASSRGQLQNGGASRDLWQTFAHGEWEPRPDWLLNIGGVYEDHQTLGGFFSPRLGVTYRLNDRDSIRLVGSRAYRMPTFFDSLAEENIFYRDGSVASLVTDPRGLVRFDSLDPDPERIDAYELGYFGQFADGRLSADFKLFYEDIRDLIRDLRLDPARPSTFLFVNAYDARVKGAETQIGYQSANDFASVAYSFADTTLRGNAWSVTPIPRHTLSVLYGRNLTDSIQLSAAAFYVDEMRWLGSGDPIPSQHWMDVKLEKRFRMDPGEATLAFSVHNLFDRDNITFRRENRDERQYLATFRYEF